MRILHVIAGIPDESGGPTQVLRELTLRLAERGHDVTVLTTDSGGAGRRVSAHGFSPAVAVRLMPAQLLRSPHPSLAHALAAARASERFDVAHVHGLFALPPSLAMAAFRARKLPYVLRPCGMLDAYSLGQRMRLKRVWRALLDQPNLEGAARVQTSTAHEAEAVMRLLPPPLHERVQVLPQGVAAPPAPSGARPHARPYLLFLSRIARKKGLLRLVEAFAALAAERSDLDLVLVGPDEDEHRAEVMARIFQLGLGQRVWLPGAARGVAKSDWLAGAEAFVLPSDDENFGVALIEAAHLGAPLVVSDRVGLAEAIRVHGAGLVTSRKVSALTSALREVLARGREPFRAGLAALAGDYAWQPLLERLEAVYRDII